MDRAGFLKNVFGAGIVLAMPKVLVDKIEALPPPVVTPPVIEEKKPIFTDSKTDIKVETYKDNCMYLYKNEHLLGYSYENNIDMKRPVHRIVTGDFGFDHYAAGLAEWDISMKHIKWLDSWGLLDEYLLSGTPITMLLRKGEHIIQGEVIVMERNNMWLGTGWVDIKCKGYGALTIENR